MSRKGCVPSRPREPALQSRGTGTPDSRSAAAPALPARERGGRQERTGSEAHGWRGGEGGGEGKICVTEVQGEQDGILRLHCTAVAAAGLQESRRPPRG